MNNQQMAVRLTEICQQATDAAIYLDCRFDDITCEGPLGDKCTMTEQLTNTFSECLARAAK